MTGIEEISIERVRQVTREGFDAKHDQLNTQFELSRCAIAYINQAQNLGLSVWQDRIPDEYPVTWDKKFWKPLPKDENSLCPVIELDDSIQMLTRAGALIAAEIDRLKNL